MKRLLLAAILILGCGDDGGDSETIVEVDAAPEATCETVTGPLACVEAVEAICARATKCCVAEWGGGCIYYMRPDLEDHLAMSTCRSNYSQHKCSVYKTEDVCSEDMKACQVDAAKMSCEDIREWVAPTLYSCEPLVVAVEDRDPAP